MSTTSEAENTPDTTSTQAEPTTAATTAANVSDQCEVTAQTSAESGAKQLSSTETVAESEGLPSSPKVSVTISELSNAPSTFTQDTSVAVERAHTFDEAEKKSKEPVQKFRNAMKERGFRIQDVAYNGDCGLLAIADQLSSLQQIQTNAQALRSQALDYLRSGQMAFEHFLDHQMYADASVYIERQSVSGEWVDEIMLRSLARCLSCDIRIFNENGVETMLLADEGSQSEVVLTIGHISEIHYVSLYMDDGIANSSDDSSGESITSSPSTSSRRRATGEDKSIVWQLADIFSGNDSKVTSEDLLNVIERSASNIPPQKCFSVDCEYRRVRDDGLSEESNLHLRQIAMYNTARQQILNLYIRDPNGAIKQYDNQMPEQCSVVESESDAIRMVQEKIDKETIVIVHDPSQDFKHLLIKPSRVRDTAKLAVFRKLIGEKEELGNVGLQLLAEKLLGRQIQSNPLHDAAEDSLAAMDLYLLAHHDIENEIGYLDAPGTHEGSEESSQDESPTEKKPKL